MRLFSCMAEKCQQFAHQLLNRFKNCSVMIIYKYFHCGWKGPNFRQTWQQCCGSVTFWYGSGMRILGSVPLSRGSGCGSQRPKNIRIWMRIQEAPKHTDPDPQHWPGRKILLRVGNTASSWGQEEQRDKKPEDLRRAIGRIDSQDWNVKAGPAVCMHLLISVRYLAVSGNRDILVRICTSELM